MILTFDKDFGELAFRHGLPAECGIVLFRIGATQPALLAHRVCNVMQSQPTWQGLFASVDEADSRSIAAAALNGPPPVRSRARDENY